MTDQAPAAQREDGRLELLYHISREIGSQLDLPELLSRILRLTADSVGAENASLVVFDEQGSLAYGWLLYDGRLIGDVTGQLALYVERGLAGWVARHGQGALIANTAEDERWYRISDAPAEEPKAAVAVPLRLARRDQVVGVLTLVDARLGCFGDSDLALLTAIADQAAIAIDNARLFAGEQRRRALSDTLQQVARSINATLELDRVVPLVLEQLARVIRYDSSAVLLLDKAGADRLRVAAVRGYQDPSSLLNQTFDAAGGSILSWVVKERRTIVIDDVRTQPGWPEGRAPEQSLVRAWIGAPLLAKDGAIGLLTVDSHSPGSYSQEDARVVAAFAEQVTIAVVNARLYEESRKQAQAMAALVEIARAVASTLDLNEVLHLLLTRIISLLGVEASSIALLSNGELEFKVAEGGGAQGVVGRRLKLGQGIAGWVAQSGRPVLVPEVRGDPRFFGEIDEQTGFVTRSIICVPITDQRRTLGVIEVMNPQRGAFDTDDLDLVTAIAEMAGNAIAHAQLFLDIQAAEARYLALFEDSIDPILITDLSGRITDANREAVEFLGYSREELKGLVVGNVHRMGTGHIGVERFSHIASGREVSFETRMTNKDGERIPVEVHAKRIVRDGQEFIQWIQRDISERLALEETRSDLTSMIVHDLRSPLGNIISSLDVLQATLPPADEVLSPVLAIAFRSSQRLSRLIDSLLDLRQLEAGQAVLRKENASANALVAEAADQVHPLAEGKAILLRLDAPPRLPVVNMDADMMRRVLINLIDNAVKYTESGGTIVVGAKVDDRMLTISVKDSGPGIAPVEQARIFNKYVRLHQERGPKGLGLGLAFCKLAIEAHGGKIWVESEPGHGATFFFTLPI